MRRIGILFVIVVMTAVLFAPEATLGTVMPERLPYGDVPPTPLDARLQAAAAGNLLVNGGMDDLPFYWMYPNHHVAGAWNRWWIHLTMLPEYDDVRFSRPSHEGDHAQVYFKWFAKGDEYHAGIYQVVDDLMPCIPYRFTMWARNHTLEGVKPHARIGLDTQGTQLTSGPEEGAVLSLPASVVWSAEQVNLFVWEQLTVEAEPSGARLTAITYAHPELPEVGPLEYYADTYWDTGRLEQISFAGGRLPAAPSATATDFVSTPSASASGDSITVQWSLAAPAPTQVWYRVIPPSSPSTIIGPWPYQVYLPVVQHHIPPAGYTQITELQVNQQQTQYEATITGLQSGDTVHGIIVVRRPVQGACTTQVSVPFGVTIP